MTIYTPPKNQGFVQFLAQFNVVGLAIGFIIAGNLQSIANSFIDTILVPLIKPLLDKVEEVTDRDLTTAWGAKVNATEFIRAMIKFTLLGMIIFILIKLGMKIDHPITYVKIVKNRKVI